MLAVSLALMLSGQSRLRAASRACPTPATTRPASTTRKAYDLLAEGFGPGFNGPLELVAQGGSPADQAALGQAGDSAAARSPASPPWAVPAPPGGKLAVVAGRAHDGAAGRRHRDLITHLRDTVIPAAEQGTTLHVYVGGTTAIFDDFAAMISAKLPLFIAVIVGLGFLLLLSPSAACWCRPPRP